MIRNEVLPAVIHNQSVDRLTRLAEAKALPP